MKAQKNAAGPRRLPQQERGQRQHARLLDAASALFARVGFEATTTNAIAREANTSVGSLYQFFPNKEAILAALTERYLGELREMHDRVLSAEMAQLPLAEMYDRLIHGIADFYVTHPGCRQLLYGSTTSPEVAAATARLHQECVSRAEMMMVLRMPQLPPDRRRLYATINVEVIRSLLPYTEAGDAASRERFLGEIRDLLLARMREVERELPPAPRT